MSCLGNGVGRIALAALLAALSAACDGGSSGGGTTAPPQPVPFAAEALVADAGDDRELASAAGTQAVTLDAAKSFFRATESTTRAPAAYAWDLHSAPAGGTVTGLPSTAANPTVTFPGSPVLGTYVFRLTVTEGTASATDDVAVVVKPFVVSAPADKIQIGFRLSSGPPITTTLAASVTGTTSGGVTYAWTGVPVAPYAVNVQGLTSDSLTFQSPRLEDVEAVPADPTIFGLWRRAGGYYRLTVTATDGTGASDSEDVIVSFGVPTSGLRTVPLDVPVYLNGGTSSDGTWTFVVASQPAGSTVSFFKVDNAALGSATDQRIVWFLPKVEGSYFIVATRKVLNGSQTSTQTTVFELNAARYVGDGLVGSIAPNPDAGNCAGCHGGSVTFVEDKVTPWSATLHAQQASAVIDPSVALTQATAKLTDLAPELSRAMTGVHLGRTPTFAAQNDGFDDLAAARGLRVHGATVDSAARRSPEVMRMSGVQCETCHGPGSSHVGDSEAIAVSVSSDSCARCHDPQPTQWAKSAHAEVVASPSGSGSCVRCHTAEGAIDARHLTYAYQGTAPSLPVPAAEGRRNTATCATCHDPHDASQPAQLRRTGDVTLPSGAVVAAGDAASCFQCHNSRRAYSAAIAGRNDPHAGLQGDMFAGTNGAEFSTFTYLRSAHGDPARFVTRTGEGGRACIGCHMAEGPAVGQAGHDELGGHTFAVRNDAGNVNAAACAACHTVGTRTTPFGQELDVTVAQDWDGDGNGIESVQQEVQGLLQRLGGSTTATADNRYGVVNEPSDANSLLVQLAKRIDAQSVGIGLASGRFWMLKAFPSSTSGNRLTIPATADGDLLHKCMWNYTFVVDDASMGIHNTAYTVGLLQSSVLALEEALGVPAGQRFQGTLYR